MNSEFLFVFEVWPKFLNLSYFFSKLKSTRNFFFKSQIKTWFPGRAIRKTADISRLAIELWVASTDSCQEEGCFSLTCSMGKYLYTKLVIHCHRNMCGALTGISGSFPWRLRAEYSSKKFVHFIYIYFPDLETEARNGSTVLFNCYKNLSF